MRLRTIHSAGNHYAGTAGVLACGFCQPLAGSCVDICDAPDDDSIPTGQLNGIYNLPGAGRPACRNNTNSAFTLIEIVISSAVMALILTSAYACFHAAISSRKLIEPRLEVLQNARVAMALISADLRAACPLSTDLDFLGMHRDLGGVEGDNLDFGTHNYTPRRPNEGDFCQVSYYLDQDPESGQYVLMRRRNPRLAPDPLSGGSREEIARGLRGLRFEYYDGLDWYDSWGDVEGRGKAQTSNRLRSNLSGLPDAVRITLWFDSNPQASKSAPTDQTNTAPPLVFQTVSRLNLAAASEKSASAGSSSDNGSDNAAQPPAGMANPGGTQ